MAETRQHLALTYEGAATVLAAAVPKVEEIGAIGVGSGTGEQDVEVAAAGVAALAGAKDWTSE